MQTLMPLNMNDAFFRAASRFWEFGLGMLVAFFIRPGTLPTPTSWIIYFQILLSGLVGMFLLMYFGPGLSAHPSSLLAFLVAVMATFLYLCLRFEPQFNKNPASRLIDLIGRGTYPFYLLHYPALVAFSAYDFDFYGKGLFIFAVVTALSYVALRYVEKVDLMGRVSITTFFILVSIFVGLHLSDGLKEVKYSEQTQRILSTGVSGENRARCHTGGERYLAPNDSCSWGFGEKKVIVLGDSHGVEFSQALSEILPENQYTVRQLTFSGCNPASYLSTGTEVDPCGRWLNDTANFLSTLDAWKVIYIFRFPQYIQQKGARKVQEGLEQLVLSVGHPSIIVWGVPELPDRPTRLLYRGQGLSEEGTFTPIDQFELVAQMVAKASVDNLSVRPLFCDDPKKCKFVEKNQLMFFDTHHPSIHGAKAMAKYVLEKIENSR
jgi:hypothetical protein